MDYLIELIRSLDKAEKRKFKLTAATYQKDNNQLLAMYEAFEKTSADTDENIKDELKLKYHAILKKKLYEEIIKSSAISQPASLKDEILVDCAGANFLLSKNLYAHAYKKLIRLKSKCYQNEAFQELLLVLSIEKNALLTSDKPLNINYGITEVIKEELATINKLQKINEYNSLYHQAFKELKNKGSLAVNRLLKKHHLENEYPHKSFTSEKHRLYFLSIVFHGSPKLTQYLKHLVQLFEEYPNSRGFDARAEIYAYYLYTHNLYDTNSLSTLKLVLEKMKGLKYEDSYLTNIKNTLFVLSNIPFLCKVFPFDNDSKSINGLFQEVKSLEKHASQYDCMSANYLLTKYCFYTGNIRLAIRCINNVKSYHTVKQYPSLYINTLLLEIKVHIDADNLELVESLIRKYNSTIQSLELEKKELYILYIKELSRLIKNDHLNLTFRKAKSIESLVNKLEKLTEIEITAWLNSKIGKIPFWKNIQIKYQ